MDYKLMRERFEAKRVQRDAEIVRLYREGGFSLRDLGHKYGITRERVRQIISNHAKQKGRKP